MQITRTPTTAVVHFRTDNQRELCETFMRPQEFYESPYPEIRGQHFRVSEFMTRYAMDHGGKFTYFEDWHGFNIPGDVVLDFFKKFDAWDRTTGENIIFEATKSLDKFYLIGTHSGGEDDALDHELVHASYYLDDEYRHHANVLIGHWLTQPHAKKLIEYLKSRGYGDSTMTDEINAYLATTDEAYWKEELGDPVLAHQLWDDGADFRRLAKSFRTNRWLPNG